MIKNSIFFFFFFFFKLKNYKIVFGLPIFAVIAFAKNLKAFLTSESVNLYKNCKKNTSKILSYNFAISSARFS